MAKWRKILTSGSAIDVTTIHNESAVNATFLTGSFTGSFKGTSDLPDLTDGNGIADVFEQDDSNETNETNETTLPVDSDNDGVSDVEDNCPGTAQGAIVDENGCVQVESSEEETNTALESFFSGEGGVVTTTVGVGAILLALFTLLQTNAVAAMLPDTFRWVQVLRKNSKLTKEERNELTYLQSLVQALSLIHI